MPGITKFELTLRARMIKWKKRISKLKRRKKSAETPLKFHYESKILELKEKIKIGRQHLRRLKR